MIDNRDLTFDASRIAGITLMQDRYLGLSIITEVQGAHVIASLSVQSPFELTFLGQADEGPGPRFFIPNCELRLDHTAIANPKEDPPLGCLIVARSGIAPMVKPPRTGPSPLRLTGDGVPNAYEGLTITRWRLQSAAEFGRPEVLYTFTHVEGSNA